MPLRDHFHPPLKPTYPWKSIHSTWIVEMVSDLNTRLLPQGYYALPYIDTARGGLETGMMAWEPRPALAAPVDLVKTDVFEVIIRESGGRRFAVIELVSPINKEHPSHRRAFVRRCVAHLQQGLGLVIVDVVSEHKANLHQRLMQTLEVPSELSEPELYAAAYRVMLAEQSARLEVWAETLALGSPLPTLPLWLEQDMVIPFDLEKSYQAVWTTLGMEP